MGSIEITMRIHSFIPSKPKANLGMHDKDCVQSDDPHGRRLFDPVLTAPGIFKTERPSSFTSFGF